MKQVTEETDTSNDSDDDLTDDEDPLFKIEEVSSVKTAGKQLNAKIIFSDTEELYNTELECQLDTGATCNVMSLHDLAVISQTGDPPLRSSKVKLKLFDGSLMKPSGVATLKIHEDNKTRELDFQIVETVNKPLLSAKTCVKATEQDPVMQTLKTTILIGWPERREEVPVQIREFWNYREELTLHNGIIFKNQRVIIPKALRPELTARAHSSHQGIDPP